MIERRTGRELSRHWGYELEKNTVQVRQGGLFRFEAGLQHMPGAWNGNMDKSRKINALYA